MSKKKNTPGEFVLLVLVLCSLCFNFYLAKKEKEMEREHESYVIEQDSIRHNLKMEIFSLQEFKDSVNNVTPKDKFKRFLNNTLKFKPVHRNELDSANTE